MTNIFYHALYFVLHFVGFVHAWLGEILKSDRRDNGDNFSFDTVFRMRCLLRPISHIGYILSVTPKQHTSRRFINSIGMLVGFSIILNHQFITVHLPFRGDSKFYQLALKQTRKLVNKLFGFKVDLRFEFGALEHLKHRSKESILDECILWIRERERIEQTINASPKTITSWGISDFQLKSITEFETIYRDIICTKKVQHTATSGSPPPIMNGHGGKPPILNNGSMTAEFFSNKNFIKTLEFFSWKKLDLYSALVVPLSSTLGCLIPKPLRKRLLKKQSSSSLLNSKDRTTLGQTFNLHTEKTFHISFTGPEDSKEALAEIARILAHGVSTNRLKPGEIDQALIHALIRNRNSTFWPSEELIVNFNDCPSVSGYPLWQLRYPEIITTQKIKRDPSSIWSQLEMALFCYSKTTQRFGI